MSLNPVPAVPATRRRPCRCECGCATRARRYPSDLTDAQWAALEPLNPIRGLLAFSQFQYGIRTVLAGHVYEMADVPRSYVPIYILIRVPLVMLLGGALAMLFAMLPYFLILTSFIGGMWLAIDSTAGERERHSLEPLLTNPVPRDQILLGKLLAAAVFSFTSLTLGLMAFSFAARLLRSQQSGMSLSIGPNVMLSILLLMVPLVLLIVISQMVVAAFAKSYREAQTYLGLLQLLPLIPSIALGVLPLTPQLWMYALPLIGQQLAMLRLLRGELVSLPLMALTTLFTVAAAIAAFLIAKRLYESERLAVNA